MKFVIGDIHGEVSKLRKLVKNIAHVDSSPELVFIGDYLDKGEAVNETLAYLQNLSGKHPCTFLLGNHEYLWLNLHDNTAKNEAYLEKYGGLKTMRSLGGKNIQDAREILFSRFGDFFSALVPFWQYQTFVAVHSGIRPEDFAKELKDIPLENFLFNRYEFLTDDELYLGKNRIIFGHTGFYTPYISKNKIGIDTAACFLEQQPLTAFCIDGRYFINSDNAVVAENEIPVHSCPNIVRSKPWRYDA
jgi:serine/threonine protein phosphatase 1